MQATVQNPMAVFNAGSRNAVNTTIAANPFATNSIKSLVGDMRINAAVVSGR